MTVIQMKLKPILDNQEINDSVAKHPIIANLVNRDLNSLSKENFIIFPQQLKQSKDLSEDNLIFQSRNGKIWTCNIVGILSDSTDELKIHSRFSNQANQEDYFLRYMLQRVLNYNVINYHFSSSKKMSYYDLLVFLFPYYLNEAMRKGLYKEYVKREYNNANIKGNIDIARHIRSNVPFVGKVAYRTREFSYNNRLTQLIRHTIEKIINEYDFLLSGNKDTKENVALIKQATPDYAKINRSDILQENIIHKVKHSYYEEYSALQQLCIQILSEEKSGFGSDKHQIHGIIIDVSWLWEEYIGKVTGWKHYGRKKELATMHLFQESNRSTRYPDFTLNNMPIDTKYKKNLDPRNDYNQLVTYIHIMNSDQTDIMKGGFLQPTSDPRPEKQGYEKIGMLHGLGGEVFTYRFFIPQAVSSYSEFVKQIKEVETALKTTFQ